MFTKAEYQITPNLMHAHAMHLRQSYYETRHYDSTTLEELHYRVNAESSGTASPVNASTINGVIATL